MSVRVDYVLHWPLTPPCWRHIRRQPSSDVEITERQSIGRAFNRNRRAVFSIRETSMLHFRHTRNIAFSPHACARTSDPLPERRRCHSKTGRPRSTTTHNPSAERHLSHTLVQIQSSRPYIVCPMQPAARRLGQSCRVQIVKIRCRPGRRLPRTRLDQKDKAPMCQCQRQCQWRSDNMHLTVLEGQMLVNMGRERWLVRRLVGGPRP